jgi:hypothetical protein
LQDTHGSTEQVAVAESLDPVVSELSCLLASLAAVVAAAAGTNSKCRGELQNVPFELHIQTTALNQ